MIQLSRLESASVGFSCPAVFRDIAGFFFVYSNSNPANFRVNTRNLLFGVLRVLTRNSPFGICSCMAEAKKTIGRPPKAEKEINPVRQIGRWSDEQWDLIRRAAESADTSVAEWARGVLLRAAKRLLK